jgi:hypothetical protein
VKTIICGIPFEVIEVESTLGSEQPLGECDVMAATITINARCSNAQKEATLVHEWIHAVAGCNGASQSEDMVSVLATELYRQGFRVEVKA